MVLTLIIIMWTISLNFKYFTVINKGDVPSQYYMWSGYSTVLVILMIVISIVQYVLKQQKNADSNEYARQLSMYSIIIFIFNLIAVCILQVILDCFTVDG